MLAVALVVGVVIIAGLFTYVKFFSGEKAVDFEAVRENRIPTDITSDVIPEYRTLERALACVVDDDVEAARVSGADGVHVGQSDAACETAREALGPDAIIGVSAQTLEQALAAQAAGADYLGVGAMIATPTKPDAEAVSKAELARICAAVDIPVVAIGGLNCNTLDILADTGVDGAAVVSAIFAADDIEQATRDLAAALEEVL